MYKFNAFDHQLRKQIGSRNSDGVSKATGYRKAMVATSSNTYDLIHDTYSFLGEVIDAFAKKQGKAKSFRVLESVRTQTIDLNHSN